MIREAFGRDSQLNITDKVHQGGLLEWAGINREGERT